MSQVFDIKALGGGDCGDILIERGDTSLERDFKMVVLPALSRPKTKILSSYFLFFLRLRRIPMRPPAWVDISGFK